MTDDAAPWQPDPEYLERIRGLYGQLGTVAAVSRFTGDPYERVRRTLRAGGVQLQQGRPRHIVIPAPDTPAAITAVRDRLGSERATAAHYEVSLHVIRRELRAAKQEKWGEGV